MTDRTNTAFRWRAVTPSDTVRLAPVPTAIYVGGAGNVVALGDDGVSATFVCSAGQQLNIQPEFVMATGTTATSIVALVNV